MDQPKIMNDKPILPAAAGCDLDEQAQRELLAQYVKQSMLEDRWEDEVLPFKKLYSYYECAIMEVETKFEVLSTEMSLYDDKNPIENIKSRLKRIDSIVRKLDRRGLATTFENIERYLNDIAGVRVICSFERDVYRVFQAFISQDDVHVIEVKDYIANPKPNGYRSLHVIVDIPIFLYQETKRIKVEIQLRTLAMDVWASLEHKIRYKKRLNDAQQRIVAEALLNCANYCHTVDAEMEETLKTLESARLENDAARRTADDIEPVPENGNAPDDAGMKAAGAPEPSAPLMPAAPGMHAGQDLLDSDLADEFLDIHSVEATEAHSMSRGAHLAITNEAAAGAAQASHAAHSETPTPRELAACTAAALGEAFNRVMTGIVTNAPEATDRSAGKSCGTTGHGHGSGESAA